MNGKSEFDKYASNGLWTAIFYLKVKQKTCSH